MQLDVRCYGIDSSEAINQRALRLMEFRLARFSTEVVAVTIRLSDTNGPRGGEDKRCRILVRMVDGNLLAVEELGVDVHAVFARAARRVVHSVGRHLAKPNRTRLREPE